MESRATTDQLPCLKKSCGLNSGLHRASFGFHNVSQTGKICRDGGRFRGIFLRFITFSSSHHHHHPHICAMKRNTEGAIGRKREGMRLFLLLVYPALIIFVISQNGGTYHHPSFPPPLITPASGRLFVNVAHVYLSDSIQAIY